MLDVTAADIRSTEPRLRQAANGWLAISRPGSALNIAVQRATAAEAEEAFAQAVEAWASLREREDGSGTT